MKNRRLKVFGGNDFFGGKQKRVIVAAYNQKDAVGYMKEVSGLGFSLHYFRGYWSETGNKEELAAAKEPGMVFYWQGEGNFGDKLVRVR